VHAATSFSYSSLETHQQVCFARATRFYRCSYLKLEEVKDTQNHLMCEGSVDRHVRALVIASWDQDKTVPNGVICSETI
jgi:hypothetical protein